MSGVVVWITGLPSAGKSTLAAHVAQRLPSVLLDSDELRDAFVPRPDYSAPAREAFYRTLANLAALLARQGHIVVVAATAQRREWRERARTLAPRFVEVFVDVPAAECRRRDAKGLYAAVARGSARDLPGADAHYEPPLSPEVIANGGNDDAAVARIASLIA